MADNTPSHLRRPNAGTIKNKAPAEIQITAEQLLREAWERKESAPAAIPKLRIADQDELLDYQRTERKHFEMQIVRNRSHTPLWIRYARWEEDQHDFVRARSIWERAIDHDYRNPVIWLNYAEMEMRHRFVNHARNIFDRAVALLPRVDQLWLKYAHMEEMLARVDLARNVFDRWLKWLPENSAYFAFIRFEMRHGEISNARQVYEQLIATHPTAQSYLKYAKFEERQEQFVRARQVFERATQHLASDQLTASFYLTFAKFEERRRQVPRARIIYKFAQSKLSGDDAIELDRAYTTFEKQHGDGFVLNDILLNKRRQHLEETLTHNGDYDTWFDLLQLEEKSSSVDRIRETYERALSCIPSVSTKPAWSQYIYIWLLYAAWTELEYGDISAALAIYKRCIAAVPYQHRKFSFGKLWLQYAHAEIRHGDVGAARRAFGTGIGVLPSKDRLYEEYIQFECALGEIERAREIYQVWLTRHPTKSKAFLALADLEIMLGELNRAVAVLELAITVDSLDDLEAVWNKLAQLTASTCGIDEAVDRFEKYLLEERFVNHVWSAYIKMLIDMKVEDSLLQNVFKRAWKALEQHALLSNTVAQQGALSKLLNFTEKWLAWEESRSGVPIDEKQANIELVNQHMPRRTTQAGVEIIVLANNEADKKHAVGNKLLEAAKQWKEGNTK